MSNLETAPDEKVCSAGEASGIPRRLEILEPREVPLGGPRAMTVRRTLPQRQRSMVGAWCFLDHYGPDDVSAGPGMQVPPHPHTGLQTVSWLFAGEVLHRDSVGSVSTVRPGELNLMTAGRGISHSEQSPDPVYSRPPVLHGVQLWTALPSTAVGTAPTFEHHADLPALEAPGALARVFLGQLPAQHHLGVLSALRSPATTFTPLVGAQIDLAPGAALTLVLDPTFEHAVLVDTPGVIDVDGDPVGWSELGFIAAGALETTVRAAPDAPARLILIGGEPFAEEIVMWWNFVGRSHEDVVQARADWARQLAGPGAAAGEPAARFGTVTGYDGPALPAPQLPGVRLAPRRNRA
ncbi:pirin family protein [Sanguibacter suarezii]|uniref:pirin family protein n=1 Tax=Sanguibacter suarezii TaxID=60921 RepID=UPI0008372DD5|nr:pirin family protein [Sanguibacter suarezii]